jgi:arsenate reductase
MAEAIARQDADDLLEVSSAGLFPLGVVPAMTIETLRRNGYSTAGLKSKPILKDALLNADLVINLSGHTKAAALSASSQIEDWRVPDPYGEDQDVYQTILEEIQRRLNDLVTRLRNGEMQDKGR